MAQVRSAEFYKRLGAHLASLREQLGVSQEALAVQLQHDQSYVSRIESAERQASVVYLLQWADALNVPFEWLAAQLAEIWRSLDADASGRQGE